MSQIKQSFLQNDSVNTNKILLDNDAAVRAKTAADPNVTADLIKLNVSDQTELPGICVYPATVDGTIDDEVVNVKALRSIPIPIYNYNVSATTPFTTSNTTDTLVTGFSVVPAKGKYAVWFNADILITQNNSQFTCTIYADGTAVNESTRTVTASGGSWQGIITTMCTADFDGIIDCEVKIRSSSGDITINGRQFLLTFLEPIP